MTDVAVELGRGCGLVMLATIGWYYGANGKANVGDLVYNTRGILKAISNAAYIFVGYYIFLGIKTGVIPYIAVGILIVVLSYLIDRYAYENEREVVEDEEANEDV